MDNDETSPKNLRGYFLKALSASRRRRPVSFYLMFAILAVVLMGSQVVYIKDDPRKLAFFLSLNFIFFLVVVYRALVDFIEIARSHFRENERAYGATLGDEEFAEQLGQRVAANQERPTQTTPDEA